MNSGRVAFDADDVNYLATHLSASQLRREVRWADLLQSNAKAFRDTEFDSPRYLFPYQDYREAVDLALYIVRAEDMSAKPKRTYSKRAIKVDVEAIKARNDIVTVVERYIELRKSGNRFSGRCPLHEDKHPSLTVYPDRQSWHCFQCNRGGDVLAFVEAVENIDFRGAAAILGA